VIVNRVLLIVLLVGILTASLVFYIQITNLKNTQTHNDIQNIRTNQFLLSTINWSTQRQKAILFMRDQIIEKWNSMGISDTIEKEKPKSRHKPTGQTFDRAYQKAEAIMKECETRYPSVKPFLLLAVQCRESAFLDSTRDSSGCSSQVVSSMGARGAWQFVPSTARLICDALGISYSDRVFTDVSLSTRMAAKYFDILWAVYGNDTLALADYNGGPRQALYYQCDKKKLSEETTVFIRDVLGLFDTYNKEFPLYRAEKSISLGAIR
jgi:hypothetical protein